MPRQRIVHLCILGAILLGTAITVCSAALNFTLSPTVTCPDNGATYTHTIYKNSDGDIVNDAWSPPPTDLCPDSY